MVPCQAAASQSALQTQRVSCFSSGFILPLVLVILPLVDPGWVCFISPFSAWMTYTAQCTKSLQKMLALSIQQYQEAWDGKEKPQCLEWPGFKSHTLSPLTVHTVSK